MKLTIEFDENAPICPNEEQVALLTSEYLQRWAKGDRPDADEYLAKLSTQEDRDEFELMAGLGKLIRLSLR